MIKTHFKATFKLNSEKNSQKLHITTKQDQKQNNIHD
jgi:hypothetical protein